MHLVNRTYDELAAGDSAELKRLITTDDLFAFAVCSGNHNPLHLSEAIASQAHSPQQSVAPGLFIASLVSAVLGTQLPGAGTLYRRQLLEFHERAHAGEELIGKVVVLEKLADGGVRLQTTVHRVSDHALILSGEALVSAPLQRIETNVSLPGLVVQRHRHFERLLETVRPLKPLPMAVVCPTEANALEGALLAWHQSVIVPILIGPATAIRRVADALGEDLSGLDIVDVQGGDEAAAAMACSIVREGRAAAVMKGHLHTDDLLRPILDKAHGLRAGRRLTHAFVMDVPGMTEPLMVTDAAINIAPDLATKVDICQNAIDLARSIGMEPRVGVLSAVETVNPAIQSSIDAALLSKMADRGQIRGGLVEGPLAMDNAVDLGAARTKGLRGGVAGQANILLVPGLDAGNMLAKQLAYVSHAEAAGVVLGAKVPVILNSRSDSAMSRLASCAVACLHHASQAQAS
ncbi:MAG: bifunctional enoyl-CoA hydratase/phosphate acetyltransferase [Betaproteobacteria bacterium]|nr:bifunctional enoyl-CoA hydratase/phosphate acetyltransferase [Pseudomonadota bacterium]NBO12455.1 bifunctional enoyl-CoA hydratase/phosphate acetyltransferase [Betaproteobacteria bacterium]NBP11128.1 bifunctional enoyl-CoA hydratase/phosphate acetyltransferase [Betaproteobacteria bacterium]NBQ08221.1 bifunctional enoyl-CoA hydratase/phosphate acetyltransferase [Betaproteobacteria bacterium]NBT64753.1 bifunctional enoyl-CoA hydratase/phosphate acetyltransferase [Betaproteobacteria bacterium]